MYIFGKEHFSAHRYDVKMCSPGSSDKNVSRTKSHYWNMCGQVFPRGEIVYFGQISICAVVILAAIINLSFDTGKTEMWVSFFGYALGAILPPPKMKNPFKYISSNIPSVNLTRGDSELFWRNMSSGSNDIPISPRDSSPHIHVDRHVSNDIAISDDEPSTMVAEKKGEDQKLENNKELSAVEYTVDMTQIH